MPGHNRSVGCSPNWGWKQARQERETASLGLGPFVVPREPKDANSFDRQLYRISIARIEYSNLTRALNSIPVRKPLDGEIDLMSGFGIRQDPFTGSPAMHTGLDLHGKPGDAVQASADWDRNRSRLERGLWPRGGHRSRKRIVDPLCTLVRNRCAGRPADQGRADRGPARLDRSLDRTTPALRNTSERRSRGPAQIPACRNETRGHHLRPRIMRR